MEKYVRSIKIYDDDVGCVDYISHMGSDLTVVNSARVSFGVQKSDLDGRDKRLISYLIKHRHTSTLEHNVVTFKFTVPIFVRSQHHRHRTWSYNEISRRYTDKGLKFYIPKGFRPQHKSNRQASNPDELINPYLYPREHYNIVPPSNSTARDYVQNHILTSIEYYKKMLEHGICREQARMILPQNLYTEYYGTVNLNNLLKFIDLRTHEGAQSEIQKVADACLEIATDFIPITVRAYRDLRGAA